MRTRTTGLAALACAVVVAVGGLAGCGGDDDSALSQDEFVTQANAVCATGNAQIEAAVPEDGPPGEEFYGTVIDVTTGTVDGVAALEPPAEMKAAVDAMVADAREALAQMRATPASEFFASDEDPFASVNAKATELGLTDCAGEQG